MDAGRQIVTLGCECLQHVSTSRIGAGLTLFTAFEAHFIEKNFTQLFGGPNIELLARQFVDFIFQLRHFLAELVGHA